MARYSLFSKDLVSTTLDQSSVFGQTQDTKVNEVGLCTTPGVYYLEFIIT